MQNEKAEIRAKLIELRQAIGAPEREEKSRALCHRLSQLEAFQKAQRILAYYPHKAEANLLPLIEAHPEKTWFLPRLVSGAEFVAIPWVRGGELEQNSYGLWEPPLKNLPADPLLLDLILVPGLAFDEQGHRLGMGKGYYDRYLKKTPAAFKIGIAFAEQILARVPQEPYDVAMDAVATDEEAFFCHAPALSLPSTRSPWPLIQPPLPKSEPKRLSSKRKEW